MSLSKILPTTNVFSQILKFLTCCTEEYSLILIAVAQRKVPVVRGRESNRGPYLLYIAATPHPNFVDLFQSMVDGADLVGADLVGGVL